MSQQRCQLKIEVVNVNDTGWAGVFYVGHGEPKSYLMYPFRGFDRVQLSQRYGDWLLEQVCSRNWDVINELLKICEAYRQGVNVRIACWCAPSVCHGDVIRQTVIQWVRTETDLQLKAERDKLPAKFKTNLVEGDV